MTCPVWASETLLRKGETGQAGPWIATHELGPRPPRTMLSNPCLLPKGYLLLTLFSRAGDHRQGPAPLESQSAPCGQKTQGGDNRNPGLGLKPAVTQPSGSQESCTYTLEHPSKARRPSAMHVLLWVLICVLSSPNLGKVLLRHIQGMTISPAS